MRLYLNSTVASRKTADLRRPQIRGKKWTRDVVVPMWRAAARAPFAAARPGRKGTNLSWYPSSSARQDCDWDTFRQCAIGGPWKKRLDSRSRISSLKGQRPRPHGLTYWIRRNCWHNIIILLTKQTKHVHTSWRVWLHTWVVYPPSMWVLSSYFYMLQISQITCQTYL